MKFSQELHFSASGHREGEGESGNQRQLKSELKSEDNRANKPFCTGVAIGEMMIEYSTPARAKLHLNSLWRTLEMSTTNYKSNTTGINSSV